MVPASTFESSARTSARGRPSSFTSSRRATHSSLKTRSSGRARNSSSAPVVRIPPTWPMSECETAAEWREGYYATGAPIIANGVLISGMAGGELTTRGFLDGWDPETGKKLWRRYTIPEPGGARLRDLAGEQRRLDARRRADLALGHVRPRARPGLLGHRQRRAV